MRVASKLTAKEEALSKKTIIPWDQERVSPRTAQQQMSQDENSELRKQELDKLKRQHGPKEGLRKFMEMLRNGE
jgi:hypothetical protein